MLTIRRSGERGRTVLDWLNSYHTFSFGDYQERDHMGFGSLRVLNEDIMSAGSGVGTHSHRDMEIITYMLHGTLEFRDSAGGSLTMHRGDVHCLVAGTGTTHSEHNPSRKDSVRFLQFWILPRRKGMKPECAHRHFPASDKQGTLLPIAGGDSSDGALPLRQNAAVYATILPKGHRIEHLCRPERHYWVQVATGKVTLNGHLLFKGDGAGLNGEERLLLSAAEPSELLLIDVP